MQTRSSECNETCPTTLTGKALFGASWRDLLKMEVRHPFNHDDTYNNIQLWKTISESLCQTFDAVYLIPRHRKGIMFHWFISICLKLPSSISIFFCLFDVQPSVYLFLSCSLLISLVWIISSFSSLLVEREFSSSWISSRDVWFRTCKKTELECKRKHDDSSQAV